MALKVLVVDDAAFVRDTVKRSLRSFLAQVEIHDAANGHRAVAALKANKIDIILSDWEMPEMSGEELLAWVRADERYTKTPFIMISSRGDKNHVVKAVQAGVNDYMTKPFTPDELQKKVAKQLNRIGYKAKQKSSSPQNSTESSLDVLTGGNAKAPKTTPQSPKEVKNAALFGKPAASKSTTAKPKHAGQRSKAFKGRAQLRVAKLTCDCEIKDVSLQAMNIIIDRPDAVPRVFDQAVMDMEDDAGGGIARLNAYVHSVTAADPRPNAERLKVIVRFVDNDPEKFELLSKLVTR